MRHFGKAISLFFVILIWGFISILGHWKYLSFFDAAVEDVLWRLRWRAESGPISIPKIFIFPIDAYSIRKFSQEKVFFPFPRSIYAEAIRQLELLGVSVIGFDIFFPSEPMNDGIKELVEIMESTKVSIILAASLDSPGRSLSQTVAEDKITDPDSDTYEFVEKIPVVLSAPNPDLACYAKGLGLVNNEKKVNLDEVIRRHPLSFPYLGREFPTLPLAMYLAWRNLQKEFFLKENMLCFSDGSRIPTEPVTSSSGLGFQATYALTPKWKHPRFSQGESTALYHFGSFYDLVKGTVAKGATIDRANLRGKAALIGVSSDFGADTIAIPGNSNAAGLVLHATMFEALATKKGFMQRLDIGIGKYLPDLIFLMVCVWIIWTEKPFWPYLGIFFAIAAPVFLLIVTAILFCYGYIIQISSTLVGFPFVLSMVYFMGYLLEGKKRALIHDLFSRQVSQEVVLELMGEQQEFLSAKRQEISVSFIDICDFTSFSERHSPARVLVQLNHYFSQMIRIIHRNRVRLDKFIGDAMMITTGAPKYDSDHAWRIVKTILELEEEVKRINKNLPKGFETFQVRYGVNSGEAILGNVGSIERMEYTVTGDTVNLASRLQTIASKGEIFIGPRTQELIKDHVELVALEPIQIPGKSIPIKAYRVIGLKERKTVGE